MIDGIRDIHDQGICHRDIKPKNMCISKDHQKDGVNNLYFIDLGISKYYKNEKNEHIPAATNKAFCGTAEFTSLANHRGNGYARRDDVESIGLNLIFFLNGGGLPWYNKFEREGKHKKIKTLMFQTSLDELCKNCP